MGGYCAACFGAAQDTEVGIASRLGTVWRRNHTDGRPEAMLGKIGRGENSVPKASRGWSEAILAKPGKRLKKGGRRSKMLQGRAQTALKKVQSVEGSETNR